MIGRLREGWWMQNLPRSRRSTSKVAKNAFWNCQNIEQSQSQKEKEASRISRLIRESQLEIIRVIEEANKMSEVEIELNIEDIQEDISQYRKLIKEMILHAALVMKLEWGEPDFGDGKPGTSKKSHGKVEYDNILKRDSGINSKTVTSGCSEIEKEVPPMIRWEKRICRKRMVEKHQSFWRRKRKAREEEKEKYSRKWET
ncbi:MAG: hypothetical protein Ta2E_09670 [Mycoplasmoidaceae bacterium]|nr:MAG: hypothetical protein Ta2E_09670 [Mycoplasmoidaceae bacterium]